MKNKHDGTRRQTGQDGLPERIPTLSRYLIFVTGRSGWAGFGTRRRRWQSTNRSSFSSTCLADQDLVAEHQRFFERVTPFELDDQHSRHIHDLLAPVGVLGNPPAADPEPKTGRDLRRHDHANRAGIDERISLADSHLLGAEHAPTDQCLVDGVRQPGLDPDLAHALLRPLPGNDRAPPQRTQLSIL
ncbi:MAG: hypothetical protein A3I00_07925 [Betaproteobacteria bacterium RIFCSPLOWO2_02_FULL_64_12]|nr:MAG: hypothetical protein A3I00_07925 [Betaproteobacteria bacterium RIFCSPLOWO2_02_FULL_64_12]